MVHTRRALLRRATATIGGGVIGALAGCSDGREVTDGQSGEWSPERTGEQTATESPEGTGDRPWYAQWLPATVGSEQVQVAVTAVETARLREHQAELQTTIQFELGADRREAGGHSIDRTAHVSTTDGQGAFVVHEGDFDAAAALTAIMGGLEKRKLETRGGFAIHATPDEPTLACAVTDGTVVHTLDVDGWDGTAWLRAAIDARQGAVPTAADTDEYAAALIDGLGSGTLVRGQRVDLNPETGYLAYGTAQTIRMDVVTQRQVVVFQTAEAVSEAALHQYLDASWPDWRSADPEVMTTGNVTTVAATIDREAFDGSELIVPTR